MIYTVGARHPKFFLLIDNFIRAVPLRQFSLTEPYWDKMGVNRLLWCNELRGRNVHHVAMSVDWRIEKFVQQSEPSLEKLGIRCDRHFGIA
jgi:hypothetical protein